MNKLTLPIIHMNGTSAQSLAEGYSDAAQAVGDAIKAICNAGFHQRDYYVSREPEAFEKARAEHNARMEKLIVVQKELEEIALHCFQSQ